MRISLRTAAIVVGLMAALATPAISGAQSDTTQGTQPANGTATSSTTQTPSAAAPASAPQPLPTPSMTAPLSTAAPAHTFDAGPFGTVDLTGNLSGLGFTGNSHFAGTNSTYWDVSNAQIFLQKTTGWWQFYLQGGAYSVPALGAPYISADKSQSQLFGPLPVGFLKLVKGNFSAQIGALPTLIGAEYTFTFENLNVERGLLWNQENAVNRGIQLNETYKKLSASLSWNDGFYSNRYTWITGSLAYALNSANTLSFVAGGNAGATRYTTVATPVQNNSSIYEVLYTYSHESWYIQPYWQYTDVPTNQRAGVSKGGNTNGAAFLFNYNFKHGISTAARAEYIASSGNGSPSTVNLLYGPGSNAFSFTLTPAYQKGGFFIRGDISVVHARNITVGDAFGPLGQANSQVRGAFESGFMF